MSAILLDEHEQHILLLNDELLVLEQQCLHHSLVVAPRSSLPLGDPRASYHDEASVF